MLDLIEKVCVCFLCVLFIRRVAAYKRRCLFPWWSMHVSLRHPSTLPPLLWICNLWNAIRGWWFQRSLSQMMLVFAFQLLQVGGHPCAYPCATCQRITMQGVRQIYEPAINATMPCDHPTMFRWHIVLPLTWSHSYSTQAKLHHHL